jgi:mRNA interferase RelE/StbE
MPQNIRETPPPSCTVFTKKQDLPGVVVSQSPAIVFLPPCSLSPVPGCPEPVAPPAEDLEKLPRKIARKVIGTTGEIADNPCLSVKKLKASRPGHPVYSLRVRSDIRALLSIHDDVLIIHVLEIEHRKHSYRDF